VSASQAKSIGFLLTLDMGTGLILIGIRSVSQGIECRCTQIPINFIETPLVHMRNQKKKKEFVHIGSIIDDVIGQYRRESDGELTRVWQIWDGTVGEAIATNAQPAAFKGKLLLVHVTNSTWIHQLQFLKGDIISKINVALGKPLVEEIKFKIGPIS
jgi:hypothetical protein